MTPSRQLLRTSHPPTTCTSLARAQKLARRIRAAEDLGLSVTVEAYIWPSPYGHRMRRVPPHDPGS